MPKKSKDKHISKDRLRKSEDLNSLSIQENSNTRSAQAVQNTSSYYYLKMSAALMVAGGTLALYIYLLRTDFKYRNREEYNAAQRGDLSYSFNPVNGASTNASNSTSTNISTYASDGAAAVLNTVGQGAAGAVVIAIPIVKGVGQVVGGIAGGVAALFNGARRVAGNTLYPAEIALEETRGAADDVQGKIIEGTFEEEVDEVDEVDDGYQTAEEESDNESEEASLAGDASPSPVIQVNNITAGVQANPQIVSFNISSTETNDLVCWESGGNIYCRHIQNGVPQGGVVLNNGGFGPMSNPYVARMNDGSNRAVVVAVGTDSSSAGVYWFIVDYDATNPSATPTRANTDEVNAQITVHVACRDSGFVVVWRSNNGDRLVGRAYNNAGIPTTAEEDILGVSSSSASLPWAVPYNGLSGEEWVFFFDNGTPNSNVYMQKYDAALNPIGGNTIVNQETSGTQSQIRGAQLGDGSIAVCWVDSDPSGRGVTIAWRHLAVDGTLGPQNRIETIYFGVGDLVTDPSIAAFQGEPRALEAFVIAWVNQQGGVRSIWEAAFDANAPSATISDYQVSQISTNDQDDPAVAVENNGAIDTVWESFFFHDGFSAQEIVLRSNPSIRATIPIVMNTNEDVDLSFAGIFHFEGVAELEYFEIELQGIDASITTGTSGSVTSTFSNNKFRFENAPLNNANALLDATSLIPTPDKFGSGNLIVRWSDGVNPPCTKVVPSSILSVLDVVTRNTVPFPDLTNLDLGSTTTPPIDLSLYFKNPDNVPVTYTVTDGVAPPNFITLNGAQLTITIPPDGISDTNLLIDANGATDTLPVSSKKFNPQAGTVVVEKKESFIKRCWPLLSALTTAVVSLGGYGLKRARDNYQSREYRRVHEGDANWKFREDIVVPIAKGIHDELRLANFANPYDSSDGSRFTDLLKTFLLEVNGVALKRRLRHFYDEIENVQPVCSSTLKRLDSRTKSFKTFGRFLAQKIKTRLRIRSTKALKPGMFYEPGKKRRRVGWQQNLELQSIEDALGSLGRAIESGDEDVGSWYEELNRLFNVDEEFAGVPMQEMGSFAPTTTTTVAARKISMETDNEIFAGDNGEKVLAGVPEAASITTTTTTTTAASTIFSGTTAPMLQQLGGAGGGVTHSQDQEEVLPPPLPTSPPPAVFEPAQNNPVFNGDSNNIDITAVPPPPPLVFSPESGGIRPQ